MSMWALFSNASLLVKLIMISLVAVSIISWAIIFQRVSFIHKAKKAVKIFEDQFWAGSDLNKFYDYLNSRSHHLSGLATIFYSGFKEYNRLKKQPTVEPEALLENIQRSMRVSLSREMDKLEAHLSFLATVGSVTPYIGLFGTVWGIMHAFMALGNVQQATLSMVAPGIAEALVATAMGLFVAIPAVVAFNRISNAASSLSNKYETFQEELTGILHRQIHSSSRMASHAL